ncbi:MAG: 26S protease regulatory subunit [Pirellulaceae bacterium]
MIQEGLPQCVYELDRGPSYWFRFGSFNEDRMVWNIDKKKLLDALSREASSRHVDMCPYFDSSVVEEDVNALPDSIELGEGSSWDIEFEEKCDNSTIQKVPIGIKPRKFSEHRGGGLSISFTTQEHEEEEDEEEDEYGQNRNIPEVSFNDIGGVDEMIGMVREVIELPLRHPALFKHLGIAPHKGILLYGPPGCGKTLIAKAIANEIQAHFVSIRGPELFTKWFGESEENLRGIFAEARKFAPSVIFFDEIDAIAQKRSGEESVRHESVFVNQLLTLMDGMETYENVCVIASTNRPELLDEAIMRPGRFDYTLEIDRPSFEGCRKIFEIHTREMPLAQCVDADRVTSQMRGFTGAEIAFVAREGAYNCLRRCADVADLIAQDESAVTLDSFVVEQSDFEKALKMIEQNHKKNAEQPDRTRIR